MLASIFTSGLFTFFNGPFHSDHPKNEILFHFAFNEKYTVIFCMAERNFITGLTSQRQSIPHFKVFTKYVNYEFETVTHMPDCHQKLVTYILHFHFNIMSSFSALGKYREAFNK